MPQGRGRPRMLGTEEQRAQHRRDQVRENVRALRRRKRPNPKAESPKRNSALQLPYSLEALMYRDAFIAAFEREFTPGPSTDELRVEICCGSWIAMACVRATSAEGNMLSNALLAARLHADNMLGNDKTVARMGIEAQDKALNGLRVALDGYCNQDASRQVDKSGLYILSTVALAWAVAELLSSKSWEGFALHLRGVGAILEFAGPAAMTDQQARRQYLGFRAVQLPFSFISRADSFLSDPKWIQFPGKDQDALANSPVHLLLDIAYQIPVQMQAVDRKSDSGSAELLKQLETLFKIRGSLDNWENQLSATESIQRELQLENGRTAGHTEKFNFEDMDLAHCFTFYVGVRIGLLEVIVEVARKLSVSDTLFGGLVQTTVSQSLKWSIAACKCLNFFMELGPIASGKLICLFPFDMAWKMIKHIQVEDGLDLNELLLWFQATADQIAKTGLPVLVRR